MVAPPMWSRLMRQHRKRGPMQNRLDNTTADQGEEDPTESYGEHNGAADADGRGTGEAQRGIPVRYGGGCTGAAPTQASGSSARCSRSGAALKAWRCGRGTATNSAEEAARGAGRAGRRAE